MPRRDWSSLTEAELLAQCEVDTYRASGPGGQKRNKTSSAVRLRHLPSGLLVIAEESRSQHENKAKALKRLRRALFLELREPVDPDVVLNHPDLVGGIVAGKLVPTPKMVIFWPVAGVVLDLLVAGNAQVSTAAVALGVSTANLVEFLQSDPKLWQETNRLRVQYGQKLLRVH
jgi:2-methylaconitate cis-trans-isomerase PrpF